ncbi:MAG TPA: hypothetical protein VED45_05995 [Steroidobacteraceae bacterium]|nr:hypothetical protein [Steroidobacteraceae bacterium]
MAAEEPGPAAPPAPAHKSRAPVLSQWLQLMLAEIARKRTEREHERAEAARRVLERAAEEAETRAERAAAETRGEPRG